MPKRKSKGCNTGKSSSPTHQDADNSPALSEPSDESGNEDAREVSKPLKKRRQTKLPPFSVSSDQERVAIMEWVQQHPMLYDKSCEDYSNKEAKKQLYQERALEIGVEGTGDQPGQRLQTWVKTQRDKVGRLMKISRGASGSGSINMTAENSRFLKRFGWIHQYRNVKNTGTPSVAGLKGTVGLCASSEGKRESEDDDEGADEEENDEDETIDLSVNSSIDSGPPSRASSSKASRSKGGPCKKRDISPASDFAQLSKQVSSTRAAIIEAMNAEKGFESQRMFAELVFHETSKMDEETWNEYYIDATKQLHQYRRQQIQKNRESQQAQQPFQPLAQPSKAPPQFRPPIQTFQSHPQPFLSPAQPFRNQQFFEPSIYHGQSLGHQDISPQGHPFRGHQYSSSQSQQPHGQQTTSQDFQAHHNLPVWSPPQERSSSSAGPAKKPLSYSDPGASTSSYDTASQMFTFQCPDPLMNASSENNTQEETDSE